MELENTSRAGCLRLPGDTKPLSLTLLCEFPRVMTSNLFLQVWDRLPPVCLQG